LDIGCGRDELLDILAEKFPRSECVGIDLRQTEPGKKRFQNEQFLRADCLHLPLRSKSAQLAFSASLLEHLQSAEPAVAEMQRVLEPEGTLVVGLPTENRLYGIARRLMGLRKPADHFHKCGYVEAILDREFMSSHARKLPLSFLPNFLSLYHVTVYGERFAVGPPSP
jgi:ubiquinone/menaquinone biosynthesis C-methylase UbiE